VWPFIAANRIHVVPPCNISIDDANAGLDVIDQALSVLD
jgi:taurine--2-oxoglutarate transaminase